jgi:hypothetical protein
MSPIRLPPSFLALHARGAFDYWGGRPYRTLSNAARTRLLKERRHLVLWLSDVEWVASLDEVRELEWARPGLFPLAHNAAGDAYAVYPAWSGRGDESVILFVPHDETNSHVYARSFSELLLRAWLETARWWDEEDDGADRLEDLSAWRGIIESVADPEEMVAFAALSPTLDVDEVQGALDALVAKLPKTTLATLMLPTRYDPKYVKGASALRAYGESVAFYEELIAEGHTRFQRQLDEARANLAVAEKR